MSTRNKGSVDRKCERPGKAFCARRLAEVERLVVFLAAVDVATRPSGAVAGWRSRRRMAWPVVETVAARSSRAVVGWRVVRSGRGTSTAASSVSRSAVTSSD